MSDVPRCKAKRQVAVPPYLLGGCRRRTGGGPLVVRLEAGVLAEVDLAGSAIPHSVPSDIIIPAFPAPSSAVLRYRCNFVPGTRTEPHLRFKDSWAANGGSASRPSSGGRCWGIRVVYLFTIRSVWHCRCRRRRRTLTRINHILGSEGPLFRLEVDEDVREEQRKDFERLLPGIPCVLPV